MPFVAVPDKNSGDVFTTAMWSTFLEGNLNAGVNRPIYDSGPLASTQAAIDILSIPATFAQLMLFIHGRGDTAASSTSSGCSRPPPPRPPPSRWRRRRWASELCQPRLP
jgi:hypothetical protein